MQTRIYQVTDNDTVRLIDAANPAQAIRFCAAQRYTVQVAKAKDICTLMAKGVVLEQAQEPAE